MNGFLVTLGTTLDDLPLGLFATEAEANDYARSVEEGDPEVARVSDLTSRDDAGWCCVTVWEFRGGKLFDLTVARDFGRVPEDAGMSNDA